MPSSSDLSVKVTTGTFSREMKEAAFYEKYTVAEWRFDEGVDETVIGSPVGTFHGEVMNNGTVYGDTVLLISFDDVLKNPNPSFESGLSGWVNESEFIANNEM